ncbi:hypothetical protein GO755_33800 [Spirosoma sp. HMF4905]|uniref:ATP-binding protein n=1 Tax=Spirosoma arboris TaxID=2682092 RepID=A0A7K1SMN0_9BACT|nr:hypothetical protein [Spirosoma arboris]MVM35050.1 hypothetical protein [Spirosoma arboris]
MKNACLRLLLLSLSVPALGQAQSIDLKPVWETDTTLRTPESVLFYAPQQVLYVSCINGQATPENKSSYIAKVGLDGKVIQLKFTDNLNVTKGMGILNGKLYVTEMTQVVEIALATGKVLKRYPIEGAVFLNDIAVDTKRQVLYITDSKESKVWELTNGNVKPVVAGGPLKGTNGLLVDNNDLLIGNGDGSLFRLNLTTKQIQLVTKVVTTSSIDGIVALGDGTYLINEVAGKAWFMRADGTTELKLDIASQQIKTADTDYDPTSRMLFVPTLFHNTVRAYSVR